MYAKPTKDDYRFMQVAMEEAQKGLKEGGIPIGSCLVMDGKVIAKGHNQRVQKGNPILHGEMDCLMKAGRFTAADYKKMTIYTTLSPCPMCSGAIRLYKIPRVVMAENQNFMGDEAILAQEGIVLINLDLPEAIDMMDQFIKNNPTLWDEDIAV